MDALAEAAFHAGCQGHTGLTKFIAQAVCGRERLLPALPPLAFNQVRLAGFALELRGLHAQQTHFRSLMPMPVKQTSHLFEDFRIELSGVRQSVCAGNRGEILVAQLKLDGSCVQPVVAQPAAHHL